MCNIPKKHASPPTLPRGRFMGNDVVKNSGKIVMTSALRWSGLAVLGIVALLLVGCGQTDRLIGPQPVPRGVFLDKILPVPAHGANPYLVGYSPPPATAPQTNAKAGTFTFTVPAGVTQFEKQTQSAHEYLLYMGQPTPRQKPFITLILAHGVVPISHENAAMHVKNSRMFLLNGLPAHEWTGHTTTGAGFAEMVVKSPDRGGELDAIAVSSNPATRKVALGVLNSIRWQPSGGSAAGQ